MTLETEQGGPLTRFDRASVASCAGTAPASAFDEIPPGGWLVAAGSVLQPTADGTLLDFGWFRFPNLPDGPLKASATFHSRVDRAHDVGTIEGVWTGRLETTLDVVFDSTSMSFEALTKQR